MAEEEAESRRTKLIKQPFSRIVVPATVFNNVGDITRGQVSSRNPSPQRLSAVPTKYAHPRMSVPTTVFNNVGDITRGQVSSRNPQHLLETSDGVTRRLKASVIGLDYLEA